MSSVLSAMARSFKADRLRKTMEASVFGQHDEHTEALFQPVLRLRLDFGDHSPRAWMMARLKEHGLPSTEALRSRLDLPTAPLIVRPWPLDVRDQQLSEGLDVASADPWAVFGQAVCLGLCSTHRYDPSRPVIWTNGSLSRGLLCYSVGGFYQ